MQISDRELQKVMQLGSIRLTEPVEEEIVSPRETDGPLIKALVQEVMEMPDREDRIEELRAKIQAGTYNPAGDEIADAMWRRAQVDRIR